MSTQQPSTAPERAALFDAFCPLYEQKPIEKIATGEVARAAGCDQGAFDRCFDDVYDLRDQLEQEVLDRLRAISTENAATSQMVRTVRAL